MNDPYKIYKTGIALNFSKKTLIIWCVVAFLISFSVFAVVPYPLNLTVFTIIFGIMPFMLVARLLLNKFVMGMRVKMYDDKICIYRSNAFLLKPANDEL